jgi:hypothetical protein
MMRIELIKKLWPALIMTGFMINSCTEPEKGDEFPAGDPPPVPGGFVNSNEVAAQNLMAHWSFEGNGKETKSGADPSAQSNVTYPTGQKGQAAEFNYGYLAYNEIAALNNLPSYTISAWINTAGNKGQTKAGASSIFTLTRNVPNSTNYEWAGNVTFYLEAERYTPSSDTLVVKGLNVTNVNGNASWQDILNNPGKDAGVQNFSGANRWSHVVLTWDGATNLFRVYGNNAKISNPDWEQRSGVGNLVFFTPTRPIIGAWGTNLAGVPDSWQQMFKGKIDELRVYNKALSQQEIAALYTLERQGR